MVEHVVRLETKSETDSLGDSVLLKQSQIPDVESRRIECVTAKVRDSAGTCLNVLGARVCCYVTDGVLRRAGRVDACGTCRGIATNAIYEATEITRSVSASPLPIESTPD
jgi:hypothetical protein